MKKFIAVVKIWPLPLLGLGVSALISMSRDAILLCCTVVVAVGYQSYSCTAHRIRVDDLAVAASKQQDRWEKGKTSDQHQSNFIDNTHAGKKGYDSERGEASSEKGHRAKKHDNAEFATKKGHQKSHNNDSGYYGRKKRGKKGHKGFAYNEAGSFRKGHSIKGKHVIHKLNESAKKNKFFDEDYDHSFDEKYDGFQSGHRAKHGGAFRRGQHADTLAHGGHLWAGSTKKGHRNRDKLGLTETSNFVNRREHGDSDMYGRNNRHRTNGSNHRRRKWKNHATD